MKKIKVLIADDHRVVRQGLGAILKTKADIHLVGEATNGLEAVAMAKSLSPDVILMDQSMPKMTGIEATAAIKAALPEIGIVALTMHDDDKTIFELVRAGVNGYLLKDSDSSEVLKAIRAINKGESIIHPHIAKKILGELTRTPPPKKKEGAENRYHLSVRELDVLQRLASGKTNKEMANDLDLSEKTVKNHLHTIFVKMEVDDRTKAAIKGIREGLIDLEEQDLSD